MPNTDRLTRERRTFRSGWFAAASLYALLIAYGSLFPLTGWLAPVDAWAWLFQDPARWRLSRPDLLVNTLAYIPLGLASAVALQGRLGTLAITATATVCGFVLSLGVEATQAYLPARVSSLIDLVLNTSGSLVGALLAQLFGAGAGTGTGLRRTVVRWRRHWVREGRAGDLAASALALWALSQLTPFIPSFDLGNLRHGVAPITRVLDGVVPFDVARTIALMLMMAALVLLLLQALRHERPRRRAAVAFLAIVLVLKIPVIGRQLSLEAIAGLAGGFALALPFARLRAAVRAGPAIALLLGGIATAALLPGPNATVGALNWVPFRAHLENPLIGVTVILETAWSIVALACFVHATGVDPKAPWFGIAGALGVGAAMFGLEFAQQFVPGRVGDVTTALIAAAAWGVSWRLLPSRGATAERPSGATRPTRSLRGRRRWLEATGAVAGFLALAGVVRWAVSRPQHEVKVDKSVAPKLPAPQELPPVSIAGFRPSHPRLPHPSPGELALLARENPGYLRTRREQARGGAGSIEAAAFTELAAPGSQDLALIARRLLELKFTWRGHEQGRVLALAYDWLHDRWSPAQRDALRTKLAEGAAYLVNLIREDRLSPYNVYLYNAPFQALMACTLALYGDDARGDAIMAFTHDLWKRRVLPVWRQIMGRNGGWHEGGEYVGIGIGQAIYQVPAMWRHATGEDLFASEPGIRGFLDFLVQRTLPDGSHFRWGDGAWFDRIVPDAAALALEFRHLPAYNLRPPREVGPTAWPWGPLSDPSLRDPAALSRQPLAQLFDGIGMLVARNRWGADATHVVFKAGDNYWSHVHLDQGAFTIHRGGPLAIDSGLYADYGSEHHMNYHYQTVAHNTITVTDPGDILPAPARNDKEKPREVANDGGQRRVGSGWGVERAPLDIGEWQVKRALYHTGRIASHLEQDGISAALADITPAYTNEQSGKGSFSHRTRRVERCWRFFAYDRVDDVVVVYDDVRATQPEFRKRWLLHSIHPPRVSGSRFEIHGVPDPGLKRDGGTLEGHVVLPQQALLNPIGGPGMEFFVDGRNYAIDARRLEGLQNRQQQPARPEPGAWRLEVSPERDGYDDQFLVVLVTSAFGAARPHRVRRLHEGSRIGVEVVGPARTTRWWFTPGDLAAQFEVIAGAEPHHQRRHELRPS